VSAAGLLALVNAGLGQAKASPPRLAAAFFGLCLLMPVIRLVSEALIIRMAADVTFNLRLTICQRILLTPLRKLEEIGVSRLMASLTEDIFAISTTLSTIPLLCINAAVVASCLIYLAWLSLPIFGLVMIFTVLGIIAYNKAVVRGERYQRLARENWDSLIRYFQTLMGGIKELRLHRPRLRAYYGSFELAAANSRRFNRRSMMVFTAAAHSLEMLVFLLIGLLIFILPKVVALEVETMASACLTILYMLSHIAILINSFPSLSRASIAVAKLEKLSLSPCKQPAEGNASDLPNPVWKRLDLVNISHAYRQEKGDGEFTLGPLNLSFFPGEMVFVTGGNGSGKTTMIKLMTGLYAPDTGTILLDGRPITEENRDDYRQLFSVVFYDFFLFEELFGLRTNNHLAKVEDYLAKLQLDQKVEIRDGRFSTIDLSQGQRRRLALLTSYLENRPICVFDEWAADQDPTFRDLFYRELLPELKSKGKTVIVITHDDRYYQLADRIIKLDYGKAV
jgi:putative ATP-binding cassette transporter